MTFNAQQKDILDSLAHTAVEKVIERYDDFYEWEDKNGRSKFMNVVTALHSVYSGGGFPNQFQKNGLDFNKYEENFHMYTVIGKEVMFKSWKSILESSHGKDKRQ